MALQQVTKWNSVWILKDLKIFSDQKVLDHSTSAQSFRLEQSRKLHAGRELRWPEENENHNSWLEKQVIARLSFCALAPLSNSFDFPLVSFDFDELFLCFISLNSESIQVIKNAYLAEEEDLNIVGESLHLLSPNICIQRFAVISR